MADLLGLIAALELERPVLMGHSMGGQTVAWASVARPDLPRALVLEDSGIHLPSDVRRADTASRRPGGLPEWASALRERTHEQLVKICRRQSPDWPDEDVEPWAESKLQLSPNVAGSFATPPRPLHESYAKIVCPVLFLKADAAHDVRARHRELIAPLADARLVHIEGAGHNVRRDRHADTLRILKEFLAGL